jgi:hypothetical protein
MARAYRAAMPGLSGRRGTCSLPFRATAWANAAVKSRFGQAICLRYRGAMKPKNITALSGITGRFEHLDGLRGVSALVVIMCHGLNTFDLALETGDPASSHSHWDIWLSGAPFQP